MPRTVAFLDETYDISNAADAVALMSRFASAFGDLLNDVYTMGNDVDITKRRVDAQANALAWLSQRGAPQQQAGLFAGGPFGLSQLPAALAIASGLGVGGFTQGQSQAPSVPPITPPKPPPGGNPHRDPSKPPTVTFTNPNISFQFLAGARDRTFKVGINAVNNEAAGQTQASIKFGTRYNSPPLIYFSESQTTPCFPYAANVTVDGFDLQDALGMVGGGAYLINVVVIPIDESFD